MVIIPYFFIHQGRISDGSDRISLKRVAKINRTKRTEKGQKGQETDKKGMVKNFAKNRITW